MPDRLDDVQPLEPVGGSPEPPTAASVRRRGPRKRIVILAFLVLLLVGAISGYFVYSSSSVRDVLYSLPFMPGSDLQRVFGKPQLRILVMGLDENWTDKDIMYTTGARTDTMIAVSIDLAGKQIGLLSIPRDLWVEIPKYGFGKINWAYGSGGPQRSEATVQRDLGTPPFDYYVVLKIDATKNIVDAIGGLDVNVEKNMDYEDSWGHLRIHLKKGLSHLDGEQVVDYIRFRHDPEGDFGRMRRQRQVLQNLVKQLRQPATLLHAASLLEIVRQNVRTDMPYDRMFFLAMGLRDVTPQMVHAAQIPADIGWTDGESVLFSNQAQTQSLVRKYLVAGFGRTFDPSTVHVKVHNGSGQPGAASAIADYLRQRGFTIVETGNAKSFHHPRTTVTGPDPKIAGEVAKQLPIRNVQIAVGDVTGGDIEILIGQDYRAQ